MTQYGISNFFDNLGFDRLFIFEIRSFKSASSDSPNFIYFFRLWWKKMLKHQKRLSQPENSAQSTHTLVEIHNNLQFNTWVNSRKIWIVLLHVSPQVSHYQSFSLWKVSGTIKLFQCMYYYTVKIWLMQYCWAYSQFPI